MRIIFMATGEIALPSLRWLIGHCGGGSGHELVAVYTQPDKRIGRKQLLTSPEIKIVAGERGIPVRQPEILRGNESTIREFTDFHSDLVIVMAYGQILPRSVISGPALACLNLHASLLPRHRGASPIQAAIREGDDKTGITLMHIVPKLDAGDMILKESLSILPQDTGGSLHDRLAELGPGVLDKGFAFLDSGGFPSIPQEESLATYAGKLAREDGEIDWSSDARSLERLIRAYDPWPGTTTRLVHGGESRTLKIHPAALVTEGDPSPPGTVLESRSRLVVNCGEGALVLEGDLQLEGRRQLPAEEFLRGVDIPVGTILGTG